MVLTMHGFSNGGYLFLLGLLSLVASMAFWFRDVAAEGIIFLTGIMLRIYNIYIAKIIPSEDVEQALIKYKENINSFRLYTNNNNDFGYYLAGLFTLNPQSIKLFYPIKLKNSFITIFARKKSSIQISESKDLVVWGEVLYSGFTTQKLSFTELYMIKLPIKQRGIIVGLLLSDGWLSGKLTNSYLIPNLMVGKRKTNLFKPLIQSRSISQYIGLHPKYVTGFSDGESTFSVSVLQNPKLKIGLRVRPVFQIKLHDKDRVLLKQIKSYFSEIGAISINKQSVIYTVSSIEDFNKIIIPRFEKYPLLTQKRSDFELLKKFVDLMIDKEHLTIEGLKKRLSLKYSMNLGLNEDLKQKFSDIVPVERPKFMLTSTLDLFLLSGLIEAEGCFYVKITQASRKIGFAVQLDFNLTQHIRDKLLFKFIQEGLGCGHIVERPENARVNFVITKLSDIQNILIPFLNKHPLHGSKRLDLQDFIEITKLMQNKEHLTEEGLAKIRAIKSNMNTGRTYITLDNTYGIINPKGINSSIIPQNKRSFHTYVKISKTKKEASIGEVFLRGVSDANNNRNYVSVNNKYPRLGFEQTSSQSSYVWSVYWDLSHYCYSLPKYKHKTRKNTAVNSVSFATRSLPCLVEIYDLFYLNKKKIILANIYYLLTPVALAHMIMGDGSARTSGLRISTDSFSVKEVVLLINVLIIKYGLKCSLNIVGGKPRIYISSSSLELLKSINPFIVPSMQYKLIKKHKSISLSSSLLTNKRPYSTFHFPSNEQKTLVPLNLFNIKQTCLFSKFARYEGTELILYNIKEKNIAKIDNKDIKEINVKSVISPHEYSIFIGLLLSHGWAVIHNKIKSKARIKFRQSYSNKEYIFYVFKEISKYCDKDPYRYINDGKLKGKSKDELLIATKWMHCFVDIYFMFYKEKDQKIVPNNIYNLLTPLVLAHWVKGGSLKLQGRGIILYTDGFNLIGVVKLINVLIIKYRLNCNLLMENNKPKIYIFRSSLNNLITIINQTNISILQFGVN
uniref:Homing endonuclease LAGLIDADG domain-containing protein n=1 Tax=Arthrobotrys musiformis TaxID=47236 RepID=A0A482EAE9_9PEZI|nr:hypothetical protein [Arthrobotrys musiformis]